jgi:hypothetical protein
MTAWVRSGGRIIEVPALVLRARRAGADFASLGIAQAPRALLGGCGPAYLGVPGRHYGEPRQNAALQINTN